MESSKPESAKADLSRPFRSFSSLFKPREKPNPQPNFENETKTQTIFSDRGYRRKIATEHNQQTAAETRKPHSSAADSNRKDPIYNKRKPNPNKKLLSLIKKILSIAITAGTITIIVVSLVVVLRKKRHAK